MTDTTLNRLQTIFNLTLGVDAAQVTLEATKDTVKNWDSIGHLRIMMAIEKEFAMKFSTADVMAIHGIRDIIEAMHARGAK